MVMVSLLGEYTKNHQSVHFKRVNVMIWEFYLNTTVKKV